MKRKAMSVCKRVMLRFLEKLETDTWPDSAFRRGKWRSRAKSKLNDRIRKVKASEFVFFNPMGGVIAHEKRVSKIRFSCDKVSETPKAFVSYL
ncbi:hypothetical protein D3C84_1007820 [compost metagenome]